MRYYVVHGKPDDYGASKVELVQTTARNAKQYYSYKDTGESDWLVLKEYMDYVPYEEEKERTNEERFYGTE